MCSRQTRDANQQSSSLKQSGLKAVWAEGFSFFGPLRETKMWTWVWLLHSIRLLWLLLLHSDMKRCGLLLQVLQAMKDKERAALEPIQLRRKARDFANKTVKSQRQQFQRSACASPLKSRRSFFLEFPCTSRTYLIKIIWLVFIWLLKAGDDISESHIVLTFP